jgi:1-acyl-sn-glycerol-3-phosphate acyltransferase
MLSIRGERPVSDFEQRTFGQRARAISVIARFVALTLPLMPVQALLLRTNTSAARRLPNWYHKRVCRLLGIRLHIDGAIATDRPVLVVANHTSWLDIPVLSAAAPVSFIAKREVSGWPFVGTLARLQRTVFVDRTRKAAVGDTTSEMAARLEAGDALVLFAEGTSTDGNRVLPFLSSLFGGVAAGTGKKQLSNASVQTLAIVYTHVHGVPLGRADRPLVGWYGDMEMGPHALALLGAGPLDVHIRIGPPVGLETLGDRKALAREAEAAVRLDLVRLLRRIDPDRSVAIATLPPAKAARRPEIRAESRRWT